MSLGTQSYTTQLLDYEQFIDRQIRETRGRIKMTDILTACVTLFAVALGLLLLEVVLDHLFGLPLIIRQLLLFAGLARRDTSGRPGSSCR